MTDKEIGLGQTKYFILQYLRTRPDILTTASELAENLELHHKTVSKHLKDMREMGIIYDEYKFENHNREIKVTEEWQ